MLLRFLTLSGKVAQVNFVVHPVLEGGARLSRKEALAPTKIEIIVSCSHFLPAKRFDEVNEGFINMMRPALQNGGVCLSKVPLTAWLSSLHRDDQYFKGLSVGP